MKKVELLAPAGNFECLISAIDNGANAVYLGGKNFSARAFANNFDNEELIKAVKYAHLRNVKVYVTLNTLLNEYEFNKALEMVKFYYDHQVDALLIQDLGLYYFIKENYPDFEIHCSTQLHVSNIEAIKNAKALGFKRVVIPRESSLDFIKQATKLGIEIETFVHGAICVSYSGQCLMSSSTKQRSANKGMCAQCCRLKYELYNSKNERIKTNTDYLLSPKDMCLVEDIPELIKAGVSSFKIEGRMKSSAYVGYVTSIYRKAIDAYYHNQEYHLDNQTLNNLKVLFNRNFTDDYLFKKDNLFNQKTPNHLGIKIGHTLDYRNNKTYIKLEKPLNQFDGIRINDFGCIVNMLFKNEYLVNHAEENDIISLKTDKAYNGDVYKTLDYKLEEEINNREDLKLPLNLHIKINPHQNIQIEALNYDFSYTSSIIPDESKNSPLTYDSIKKQFSKLNDTVYYLNEIEVDTANSFLAISVLNQLRRDFIDALNDKRLKSFKRQVIESTLKYQEINLDLDNQDLIEENDYINDYPINYVINNENKYIDSNKAVISEFGGLLKEYPEKIAYYTLNCSNSYAYEFLLKLGFKKIILSTELNEENIIALIQAFKERNNLEIRPYCLISGLRSLMYLKANPFKEYLDYQYLSDGINNYTIRNKKDIIELNHYFENPIQSNLINHFIKK